MKRALFILALLLWAPPLAAREVVDVTAPVKTAVTVYRDPDRSEDEEMDPDWPEGFAMISETRKVTIPAGRSTLRFTGVAEGMIAVSAIVTGLPGGTIEKNRNADLLSPAALVDGMLGNRIKVTRTNPATGQTVSEEGIVRTRADGGLVLQTVEGFEAVRCSGLPERLTFPYVPNGLSPQPVFAIDTYSEKGGTYEVTLSYLAWGFDWQAHYVATLDEGRNDNKASMRLLSWLTILNDNGQSFPGAELMAVAGKLNIESDFEGMAEPPTGEPLRLTCYPFGSTASGSPLGMPSLAPPPPAETMADMGYEGELAIVVTGSRMPRAMLESASAISVIAAEERLGDLKLYRIPVPVDVNAKGLKQVAFLNKQEVKGEFLYVARCDPWDQFDTIEDWTDMEVTEILLATKNVKERGLGVALPAGGFTVFEPTSEGPQLVGEETIRDYAVGQDVEINLGESNQVFSECATTGDREPDEDGKRPWIKMKLLLSNANSGTVRVRAVLGWASEWEIRGLRDMRLRDGKRIVELEVPGTGTRELEFRMRMTDG